MCLVSSSHGIRNMIELQAHRDLPSLYTANLSVSMVFVTAWSFDINGDLLNCLFEICSRIIIILSACLPCRLLILFHTILF